MSLKLHIGCGLELKHGYVNIDRHTKEEIMLRYDVKQDPYPDIDISSYNILALPYADETVDEILCEGFLEHLEFLHEKLFFIEVQRLLKVGGHINFTVPDFDSICKQWLEAEDDFKAFWERGAKEHWFGNWDRNVENKWGFLTAAIFGNQNGEGQFHQNAYTAKKIMAIMNKLKFSYQLEFFPFKYTDIKMIRCKGYKMQSGIIDLRKP